MIEPERVTQLPAGAGSRRKWIVYSLLALVIVSGFALRVWNINFDKGIGSHPDERSTACFYAASLHIPDTLDEFWDPHRSTLNPLWDTVQQTRRSFTYGHFPLYLGVAMGEALHRLAPLAESLGAPAGMQDILLRSHQDCDAIAVAGRLTIALLDTLTILLVFLLGRLLYGPLAGLLAAAFYAFSAQAIQLSHFFAMDPASTTFVAMSIYFSVRMTRRPTYANAVGAGIAAGLAIASKFSSLPVLAAPVSAGILVIILEGQRAGRRRVKADGRVQFNATVGVLLAMVFAGIAFFVTSPYAVLDWQSFIQATLVEQGRMVRGVADMPFTRQYRNTLPYVYFIQQQVQWGLWWPLGILSVVAAMTMFVRLMVTVVRIVSNWLRESMGQTDSIRIPLREQVGNIIIWSWVLPYFAITGAFLAKFNRYMSPILPFTAVFAAGLLWLLWMSGRHRMRTQAGEESTEQRFLWRPFIAAIVGLVALAGSIFWSVAYVNGVYRTEHNWITASRWFYENAQEGSVILWELWDDPLPKSIPGEPGMDMGTHGLRNIDWSPYEEDTAAKYEILKSKLREADYVAYSSKRIYDSVDELPQRYPMTTRYYDAMWDGSLGFELALDVSTPPRLFGLTFEDRSADESWSLYDHPQVTVFRKVRDLSDKEFDEVLGGTWVSAIPYSTGELSFADKLLVLIGLRAEPGAENKGLFGKVIGTLSDDEAQHVEPQQLPSLMLDEPLSELSVVDNYRWNEWASERPWASALVWWAVLSLLGWAVWPILFVLFSSFRDRGYLLSRTAGWLAAAWLLWYLASFGIWQNTVRNSWIAAAFLVAAGIVTAIRIWPKLVHFVRKNWRLVLAEEIFIGLAFLFFLLIRMANPDLWQPWFGGEKFMDFAFLNGILRSPNFPPLDPHFAGGIINYYYFGIYLAAYLIKLTGIYAEVGINLTIATLFALTVANAFAIAHSAWGFARKPLSWRSGFGAALLAPLFIAVLGNLNGFVQIIQSVNDQIGFAGRSPVQVLVAVPKAAAMMAVAVVGSGPLPGYDFWGPSRVLPATINEFPYWSFLFADLHPHVIGIPLALLFAGFLLAYLTTHHNGVYKRVAILVALAFLLGALSSVNLWELPTYAALGTLVLVVYQFKHNGHVRWLRAAGMSLLYLTLAFLFFLPFFHTYRNIGASGIGLVREPDSLRIWIQIWALFLFVVASWIVLVIARHPRLCGQAGNPCAPTGIERALSLSLRKYDRLPRVIYLHKLLIDRPTFGYLVGLLLVPAAILLSVVLALTGHGVLALCLVLLAPAWLNLWKRGSDSDPAALLVSLLSVASLAILAGTQLIFLRDFLQGGDWYRMNTLFKFFMQVWVLMGLAAAIAAPRVWRVLYPRQSMATSRESSGEIVVSVSRVPSRTPLQRILRICWTGVLVALIAASLAFLVYGTPARLSQRLVGWRPDFGTLNGLDYMRQGTYTWPDGENTIELSYDWDAIQWLLDNMRGNPVVVETSEVDYYRAGGTRVASLTGISGLRGMHESEQRPGDVLSDRDALHREFWDNPDIARTEQIINELDISLVYVGQLERYLHPSGVEKLTVMEEQGILELLYSNEKTDIYGVKGKLVQTADGYYVPRQVGEDTIEPR